MECAEIAVGVHFLFLLARLQCLLACFTIGEGDFMGDFFDGKVEEGG